MQQEVKEWWVRHWAKVIISDGRLMSGKTTTAWWLNERLNDKGPLNTKMKLADEFILLLEEVLDG